MVTITPKKRRRHEPSRRHQDREEQLDQYKIWLAKLIEEEEEIEYKDDYRHETIKTYKEWLRQKGYLPKIMRLLAPQQETDAPTDEDGGTDDTSSITPPKWPSHARRPRVQGKELDTENTKKCGRGTMKGLSAAYKRFKLGSPKLKVQFSSSLGGPVGDFRRTFVDEVVLFTRKRAPLIGVKSWKGVMQNVKDSIASDVLNRWELQDIENPEDKIWSIAKERYKGWRSSLSATYRAYNSYEDRMKNKPEDIDIVEWHYLINYFGCAKFKDISIKNSENRQLRKTNHVLGSKPLSQVSYEKSDRGTRDEPTDMELWVSTHTNKDGEWSSYAAKEIYEQTYHKIADSTVVLPEEENLIFQTTYKQTTGCKSSRTFGRGYLAKYPTRSELLNERLQEQVCVAAAAAKKNIELQDEVQDLKERLANEAAERKRDKEESRRLMEQQREATRNDMRKEFLAMLAEQKQSTPQQTTIPTQSTNKTADTSVEQAMTGTMHSNDVAATPTDDNTDRSNDHIGEQVAKSCPESVVTTEKDSNSATHLTSNSGLKRNLFPHNKGSGAASFVSGHQLVKAVRTRSALKRK